MMILLGPFMRSLVIPREAEKKEETYPTMNKVPLPSTMASMLKTKRITVRIVCGIDSTNTSAINKMNQKNNRFVIHF